MKRFPATLLATCLVPWDERLELDEAAFRREVHVLSALTPHLYVFGTAGEGYAVSDAQFERIARVFADEARELGVTPMLGVVSLSLPTTVERIELGLELGCREFQLSLPSWGPLADGEVDAYFDETCGRFREARFLHYNLLRTKRLLGGEDYARLSAAHPNLVAVKFSTTDRDALASCLTKAPELQIFPTEIGYALVRDEYEVGLLASACLTNLGLARRYFEARGEELRRLAEEVQAIDELLAEVADDEVHIDGAFDKLIYKLHDPEFPLRMLPPYRGNSDAAFARFRERLPARWRPSA
jgi:Dihydrodipicolinate synthetase family